MRGRIAMAAGCALALMIGMVSTVSAAPTEVDHGSRLFRVSDIPIDGICPFEFELSAQGTVSGMDLFTSNGARAVFNMTVTEVDTLVGPNGVPLVSQPYTSREHITFDLASGDGHDFLTGTIAKFVLPDGSTFFTAGRVTSVGGYVIVSDYGVSGDVNALCAALE